MLRRYATDISAYFRYFFLISLLIAAAIFYPANAPGQGSGGSVYILCFHAFLDKSDPYSLTESVLKEQMEAFKGAGFKFITMEDIIHNRVKGSNNILVTVDDGNRSVWSAYFNVMKPMGIKPLLGIYPAIIGRTSYALTWEQLKELSDEGCYVAAHGFNHLFLSEKAYNESPEAFMREIHLPGKILERNLGIKTEVYVYPFGVKSDRAVEELRKAGYRYAFTIVPAMASIPPESPYEIPRFLMTKSNWKSTTHSIISQYRAREADFSKNNSELLILTTLNPERDKKSITGKITSSFSKKSKEGGRLKNIAEDIKQYYFRTISTFRDFIIQWITIVSGKISLFTPDLIKDSAPPPEED